jgi:hypothetical protein
LACKKAEELAHKIMEERRQTQKDVSRLVAEEQAARKKVAELGKVEQNPIVMDVHQRKRHETTEPVVSEMHIDEKEEKSLGSKIIDSVKSFF